MADGNGKLTVGGDQQWYPKEGFIPPGACGATAASNVLAYLLRSRQGLFALAFEAGLTGLAEPLPSVKHYNNSVDIETCSPVAPKYSRHEQYVIDEEDVTNGSTKPFAADNALGDGIFSVFGEHYKNDDNIEVNAKQAPNTKSGYIGFMKKVYRFLYPRIGGLMADQFLEGIGGLAEEYSLPIAAECLRVPIARSVRPSFADAASFISSSLEADIPVAFLILSGGGVAKLDTWHWVTVLAIDEETKCVQVLDNTEVFWADISAWLGSSIMGGSFVRLAVRPL